MPWHIRARPEDIAETVFVVGDPGRAARLSRLMDDPALVNDYRGLLVYTGLVDGRKVTVATHGMGAGSAAIVFEELIRLGAKSLIRLGTAGGIQGRARQGALVVADSAGTVIGGCGLGQYAPGLVPPLAPDHGLACRVVGLLGEGGFDTIVGPVFCSDAFYAEDPTLADNLAASGFVAVDMETAILYYIARLRGARALSILLVTNIVGVHEPAVRDPDEVLAEVFWHIAARL